MGDLLFVAVVLGCFAGVAWFVRACAWVVGRADGPPVDEDAPGARESSPLPGSHDAVVDP